MFVDLVLLRVGHGTEWAGVGSRVQVLQRVSRQVDHELVGAQGAGAPLQQGKISISCLSLGRLQLWELVLVTTEECECADSVQTFFAGLS